jgi:hypothetical protein
MFRVLWGQYAAQDLTRLWNLADPQTQDQISAAYDAIVADLESDPIGRSESRDAETIRILFRYPLGILFAVTHENQTILVLTVWRFRHRAGS